MLGHVTGVPPVLQPDLLHAIEYSTCLIPFSFPPCKLTSILQHRSCTVAKWLPASRTAGREPTVGSRTEADRFFFIMIRSLGRDSSVGIETRYGLEGPGMENRCGRDFPHPSIPALAPTQYPIQWVPGLSWR